MHCRCDRTESGRTSAPIDARMEPESADRSTSTTGSGRRLTLPHRGHAQDDAEQRAAAGEAVDEHDGPGAATASRASRSGAGRRGPARRGRQSAAPVPTAPQSSAAAHAALPAAPNSPMAPLIARHDGSHVPNTVGNRLRLDGVEARGVRGRVHHIDVVRRQPGIVEASRIVRASGSGRDRATRSPAPPRSTAATPRISPRVGPRRGRRLEPEHERAFAHDEPAPLGIERRQPPRERRLGRHHLEAIVRLEERLVDRVDATGDDAPRPVPPATRSTAPTTAARPDASLWLTVTLGPRSLNSRPVRPAAEFPTVLSKSSAGAPVGTAAKQRVQELLGGLAAGRPGAEQHAGCVVAIGIDGRTPRPRAPASSPRPRRRRCDRAGGASSAGSSRSAGSRSSRRRGSSGIRWCRSRGAARFRWTPASSASRKASCDVPNTDTIPMPDTVDGAPHRRVRYH